MVELIRTNDLVLLSWLQARLREDHIEAVVMDAHTSAMDGGVCAIPRRVMVFERDYSRARWVLHEAQTLSTGSSAGP